MSRLVGLVVDALKMAADAPEAGLSPRGWILLMAAHVAASGEALVVELVG
jgi:hypothetical protein